MPEPMSDKRLEQLAGLAELSCNCGLPDCEIYMSGLTRDQAQDLAAEAKRARAELAEMLADTGRVGPLTRSHYRAALDLRAAATTRAETAERELAEMQAERDWQPGRLRQVRRPDGSLWMETSDGDEAEAEARKQGWPLYRLWECRETEWRPEDGDRG